MIVAGGFPAPHSSLIPYRNSGRPSSFCIDGDLTIVGVTQPVTVEGQLADRHDDAGSGR